jgi:hypothetical protein
MVIRMRLKDRVDRLVNARRPLDLVAHSETHVEHQRLSASLSELDGIVDRAEHAAAGGNTALRAVRDLESKQLRARCHTVEARHTVEIVAGGNASHVRAVAADVEHQIEIGLSVLFRKVHPDIEPCRVSLWCPPECLPSDQVVVHRALARERAIPVGIRQQHPTIGGPGDQNWQSVAVPAVGVQVRCGRRTQRQLRDGSAIVWTAGADRGHPAEAAELTTADFYGVALGGHPLQPDSALAGEIAQIQHFRRVG